MRDALTLAHRYTVVEPIVPGTNRPAGKRPRDLAVYLVIGKHRFLTSNVSGNLCEYYAQAEQQRIGEALAELLELERVTRKR